MNIQTKIQTRLRIHKHKYTNMNVQTKNTNRNTNTNKNTQTQIQKHKHKQVEPNGEYVKPPQEKMSYATMVFVRTAIGEAIVHSWCSVCFYDY